MPKMSHHDLLFDAGEERFRGAYETKSITNQILVMTSRENNAF
jgi:hypothetical protein